MGLLQGVKSSYARPGIHATLPPTPTRRTPRGTGGKAMNDLPPRASAASSSANRHAADAFPDRLILVSHGYENIYERGFCNGLADSGRDYTLISSDRTDYSGMRRRPGTRFVNLRGSQDESRPRWRKALNQIAYHLRLMAFVARHRQAVVHLIGLIHPAWLCGVIEGAWFRMCCRRYIVTAHDLMPHDRHTAYNRFMFGLSYRLAHRVVVHTERMRDELVTVHRVERERIVVMPHGLEPLVGTPPALRQRTEGEPLHIVFFGKVMRYKGVDLLVEALADVPVDFRLRIGGVCRDDALTAELRQRIEHHPRRESIEWVNEYVAERDIAPMLINADVLVLPYRRIDQSGVLFQALRFGLPVVATEVGSFTEYVTPAIGELCKPESVPALRDALLRLHRRHASMDRHAIQVACREYEWQNTVGALREAYV